MTWLLISGGLLVYIAGFYYFMYKSLLKSPGPAGLGWFAFPAAPIIGIAVGVMLLPHLPKFIFYYLPKKLYQKKIVVK